jgi:acyl-CoA thioesterase
MNTQFDHRLSEILAVVNAQTSGFMAHLSLRLIDSDSTQRTAHYAFEVDPWGKNPAEILHGGMTASLFDMVMGITGHACSDALFTPTVQLQVQYLKPVPLNATLHFAVKITSVTKTLITATAESWVNDEESTLVATSSATYHQGF